MWKEHSGQCEAKLNYKLIEIEFPSLNVFAWPERLKELVTRLFHKFLAENNVHVDIN